MNKHQSGVHQDMSRFNPHDTCPEYKSPSQEQQSHEEEPCFDFGPSPHPAGKQVGKRPGVPE